jgi:hypothetical protein
LQQLPAKPATQLRVVPTFDTGEFDAFIAELGEEDVERLEGESDAGSEVFASDEALAELGYPVVVLAGDELPDRVDETADCHEAAVINIEIARLRRYLREMEPVRSNVVRLSWGVDCERRHTQREVAARTGISQASVCRLLDAGMAELRRRFGVEGPDAA